MRRRRGSAGLTLLELLTVISIFALMLAFSVFFMQNANKDLGVSAGLGHIASLFRIAQQHARTTAAPAWVVLDTNDNSLHALLKETVGEWHLEDSSGFGSPARITGGTPVPGRIGRGLSFSGSGTVACGEVPLFTPDQGIAVELWFLRRGGGRGILARVADQVELTAEANGQIQGKVGSLRVDSGNLRLPPDAWCHIQLIYSGRDLRLFLNRNACGTTAGTTTWTPGPFQVGDSRSGVFGIVDEIRLSLITPQERYVLAAECRFDFAPGFQIPPGGKVVVGFDPEGRLDPSLTPPFVVAVKSSADRRELKLLLSGTLQR